MIERSNEEMDPAENPSELSRRAVLMTAAIAATAGVGVAVAETSPSASYGAPLVEMSFPVGVLTPEQKAAMIKGVTDVVHGALKLSPDPTRKLFVEIFETPESGFGVNGQVIVPRSK
jgi:phenylpyruvate tautomerase PptA (4-oxalocrotonate tautomerase family)